MLYEIKQRTVVKPGGVIKLTSPSLPDGTIVEVIISVQPSDDEMAERLTSLTSFLGAAPDSFATSDEADQFICQERDS